MAEFDDLRKRLERVEAELALHRLAHEYCVAADHRDAERWAGVWTEDAEWRVRPGSTFSGLGEIVRAVGSQWVTFPIMQHATTNHMVDVNGDTATGRADVSIFVQLPDGEWVLGGATYQDEYRRTPLGWRIHRREVVRPFDLAPLPTSPGPLYREDDGRVHQRPES